MRGIRARGVIGIVLAAVLIVGAIGGWMLMASEDAEDEPIVVGTTVAPTMVDPAGTYDAGGWALVSNLYQSLLTIVPGQEAPAPDAASSCQFTDNQLTVYRCTLRAGLRFSNGDQVTPQDVQFSYERILAMADRAEREAADDSIPEDEKFQYAGPASLLDTLEAVRVDGQDIIFELSKPNATFPFVVASPVGAIVNDASYEEHEPRTDGEVVGSGPFLLTEFEPNEQAELEPNPTYVGAAQIPQHPVTVRYFVESDDGGRADDKLAEAWEQGELDVNAGDMPPEVMENIGPGGGDERVHESAGGDIRVMAFNTDPGMAMSDPAARRAVAAELDREAIARHIQHGTVDPLYSLIPVGFAGASTPYYDAYDAQEIDPEEMRQQLVDAGLEVPVKFELAYSRGAASHEEAELIEAQLEANGLFDVTIDYHDWSQEFIPTIFGERSFDAYLIGWVPDYPDPGTFVDLLGPADGLATGYSEPAINELLDGTQAEADRARAARDFETINELAAEDAPIIPIWQAKHITISDDSIAGAEYLSDNSGIWRLWELYRL
ncbi:ABC transporter substrate-binding protein [Streptomyces sp. B6B3]|uniref:ABC transporter substrate-binding protein n=1 Tax=Streptomyces sp. B6B3 TaxID=3153570 RepID=UPI00325CDB4A